MANLTNPTLIEMETLVRNTAGNLKKGRWTQPMVFSWLREAIRDKQAMDIPNDALREMILNLEDVATGESEISLDFTVAMGRPSSFRVEESDGNIGRAWDLVGYDFLRDRRYVEGDLTQDESSSRLYAFSTSSTRAFNQTTAGEVMHCYPAPTSGRSYELTYYREASEGNSDGSGIVNLPMRNPDMITPCVNYAIGKCGLWKSFDLDMGKSHMGMYNDARNKIKRDYFNRFGMTPARIGLM